VWDLVLRFFTFLSVMFPGFSLVLDPSIMGGLGGNVGSACEKYEDNEGGI